MRGATRLVTVFHYVVGHFNPRTPCGVRPARHTGASASTHFNPRTPCGVRHLHHDTQRRTRRFQSTHPLRGATDLRGCLVTSDGISIHAPLAGCDEREVFAPARGKHFNPRTPCGVRLPQCAFDVVRAGISIHAPLAGCDILRRGKDYINLDFNPRTPCGVRRASLLNGTLIF